MTDIELLDLFHKTLSGASSPTETVRAIRACIAAGLQQVGIVYECIPRGGYVDMPDGSSEWRDTAYYAVTMYPLSELKEGEALYVAAQEN